jgi:hypothetical protein
MNNEQRQEIIRRLQQGEELSPEWARILFPPEKREYELVYHGKEREEDIIASTLAVPLQKVRTFGRNGDGWHNMLIFGDNLQVMKSLLEMKRSGQLCSADGTPGVRLVYIDPPFASKQEFRGNQDEKAYQDKVVGAEFVEFVRRRLVLLRELLAEDGSIFLHMDQRKVHYLKVLLDEVFGEYKLFEEGYIDLPTQIEAEDVIVGFERAVTGEHVKFNTTIQHKTWTVEEVAEQMYQKLKSIDDESKEADDPKDRTRYAKRFPLAKCEEIVKESLKHAKIKREKITDENRQKFWQALGTLRRKAAKRVVYKLSANALIPMNTANRQDESCSAAELRRGSKTVFYAPGCEATLIDDQREFFREVDDQDGDFVNGRVIVEKTTDFKTPTNLVIADATPERKFIRELNSHQNALKVDAWLKNTPMGFYSIEYAWKKGNTPKRGEFSPDFFLKKGNRIFVVEVKGDEEIGDPSSDNIKKHEYASEHFKQLNSWLEGEQISTRYQFNIISPKSYNVFFQKLRDGELIGFRSELDVTMSKAAKAAI